MLFNAMADLRERITSFHLDRILKITGGRGPVTIPGGGRLILHLIPLSAFIQGNQVNLEEAFKVASDRLVPMSAQSWSKRFNLDGLLVFRGGKEVYGYTQVFRNGIIEATRADIVGEHQGTKYVNAGATARDITTAVCSYCEGMRALNISPPVIVLVSYQGVGGARLGLADRHGLAEDTEPFPTLEVMTLPDLSITDYGSSADYIRSLRLIFDALWNAAGFSRCTYYDQNGHWSPPR